MIYDSSLKFSRATYGVLLLLAVIIKSEWLVLAIALLVIIGAFSMKLNIPYQFHALIIKKRVDGQHVPVPKESGEIRFVASATGILLLIGYALLQFNHLTTFAWVYLIVVDLMIFLACFVGFCVATLMYVLFKKLFAKPKINGIEKNNG